MWDRWQKISHEIIIDDEKHIILNYFRRLGFVSDGKRFTILKKIKKKEEKTKINKKTVIDLLGFKRLVQKRIYTLGTLRLFIKGK